MTWLVVSLGGCYFWKHLSGTYRSIKKCQVYKFQSPFWWNSFYLVSLGKAQLVAMATRKLPDTCLFVIFLCQFLKWSVEPLERRSAAPCLTVKSPGCLSGRRAGRRRRERPESSLPQHVFTRLRLWRQALNLELEVHSGSLKKQAETSETQNHRTCLFRLVFPPLHPIPSCGGL